MMLRQLFHFKYVWKNVKNQHKDFLLEVSSFYAFYILTVSGIIIKQYKFVRIKSLVAKMKSKLKYNKDSVKILNKISLGARGNSYEGFRGPLIRPKFFSSKVWNLALFLKAL